MKCKLKLIRAGLAVPMLGAIPLVAQAADMPVKALVYTTPATPAYNWSGIYMGGQLGGGWSNTNWTFQNGANPGEAYSQNKSGFIGGGQAGFNSQWSNIVASIDVSWTGNFSDPASNVALLAPQRTRQSKIDSILLVTPRVGYAQDRWLVYGKGGWANAQVDFTSLVTSTSQVNATSGGRENGWTIGAGGESAISQNVILGVEYDYVKLNPSDRNLIVMPGFTAPKSASAIDASMHMLTARLNYKFNSW